MQALTDNALMLKVKSGDLDKLGLLYERHKRRLFGFFYNMSGNASLSEDLVQNVFVRMLKYKHTFTGEGSFAAWMFRTARNVNHDHYRKHKRKNTLNDLTSIEYKLEDAADLNVAMDRKDEVSQLNRAMQKLPREKREILILSKYKEIKYSEIGEILGCSEGAAKVKTHRALNDLRTIFLQMETR
ncbi:MAG: RNA polymerase sigma factor [Aurantibacter sp.]